MKRALLIVFVLFVTTSMAFAQQSIVAVDDNDAMNTPAPVDTVDIASPAAVTQRVTVQKVAQPEPLSASESCAVEAYMVKHRDRTSWANRESLRAALTFLLGIRQSHLPLGRSPKEYLADYQLYTQTMEYTDFYVNLPVLPAFTGGGSQGPLVLDDVPPVIERAVCGTSSSTGAIAISHPGSSQESPIGSAWKSWIKIPQQPQQPCQPVKPTPPPSPYCPPGTPPDKPPTVAPPLHDPSGLEPNGPPAGGGPPVPTTGPQAPRPIGDDTGIPQPRLNGPNVADPVASRH